MIKPTQNGERTPEMKLFVEIICLTLFLYNKYCTVLYCIGYCMIPNRALLHSGMLLHSPSSHPKTSLINLFSDSSGSYAKLYHCIAQSLGGQVIKHPT